MTRAVDFSASLRVASPELSDEENRRLFGPRTSQHGHNYRLEVTIAGEPDPRTGMVMDLSLLKALLEREIVARFDHRDLNCDSDLFEKAPPTVEQVALVCFRLLDAALPPGRLDRVRLVEDADTWADVVAPEPAP